MQAHTSVFEREKSGWDDYHDILDTVERGLKEGDAFASSLKEKAKDLRISGSSAFLTE